MWEFVADDRGLGVMYVGVREDGYECVFMLWMDRYWAFEYQLEEYWLEEYWGEGGQGDKQCSIGL